MLQIAIPTTAFGSAPARKGRSTSSAGQAFLGAQVKRPREGICLLTLFPRVFLWNCSCSWAMTTNATCRQATRGQRSGTNLRRTSIPASSFEATKPKHFGSLTQIENYLYLSALIWRNTPVSVQYQSCWRMLQLKPSLRQLLLYHEALTVLQLFRTRSVQGSRYMQQVP
jgi:hypothetical protein